VQLVDLTDGLQRAAGEGMIHGRFGGSRWGTADVVRFSVRAGTRVETYEARALYAAYAAAYRNPHPVLLLVATCLLSIDLAELAAHAMVGYNQFRQIRKARLNPARRRRPASLYAHIALIARPAFLAASILPAFYAIIMK